MVVCVARKHLHMSGLITMMSTLIWTRSQWQVHEKAHAHSTPKTLTGFRGLKHTTIYAHATTSCTFQAADPPEAGVGESPGVFLVLIVGVFLWRVSGAIADEGPGVEPVIRTNGHCHEGKSRECSHGGQQHLDASLAPNHRRTRKETNVWHKHRQ